MTIFSVLVGICAAGLNLSRPILLGIIIGELVKGDPQNRITWLVILFILSWCATWIISLLIRYLSTKVSQRILKNLRLEVLYHLLNLPLIENEQLSSGKIQAYTSSDLPVWATLYGTILTQVVHSIAQLVGAGIALVNFDPQLTVIILPFLLIGSIAPIIASRTMIKINRSAQDAISGTLETLSGMVQGSKDIISLNVEKWSLNRFKKACDVTYKAEIKRNFAQGLIQVFGAAAEIIAYVLVLAIGGGKVLKNELEVGQLVSFLATIEMIFFPARNASDLAGTIQSSLAAANRVLEFLKIEPKRKIAQLTSRLEMRSISFQYPDTDKLSLNSVSCTINKGDLVVIIGESGSGKSTLLKIIAGLYDPTNGEIIKNGESIGTPSLVWQDPCLFNVSVFENLSLDRDISIEKVREVTTSLNLDETIMKLPNQYHTLLQENGSNFSGGQRRRLAIARSLLSNKNCILLDEPTAGLDIDNARKVWDSISKFNSGATRIITTHRLEETQNADLILVLQEGRLIENGSPEELMLLDSYYKKMITQYQDSYLSK